VIYSAAALLITWPLITQISTYALGAGYGDQFENIRLSWWTHYALQHGFSPFYQTLLGYPDGFFSATQWTEPLTYWPAALLSFVVTPVAAYNLCVLISLVLSGLAAFYLCWSIAKREPMDFGAAQFGGALLGGLIYMAYPAVQGHISGGHIGILTLYALPIYALCLWRIMNVEARRRTILIGAAVSADRAAPRCADQTGGGVHNRRRGVDPIFCAALFRADCSYQDGRFAGDGLGAL